MEKKLEKKVTKFDLEELKDKIEDTINVYNYTVKKLYKYVDSNITCQSKGFIIFFVIYFITYKSHFSLSSHASKYLTMARAAFLPALAAKATVLLVPATSPPEKT